MKEENSYHYLKALRSKPLREVEMKSSPRRKAFLNQNKKCFKCKKEINPTYCRYLTDPVTKELKVICASCAVPTIKKRR